MKKEFTRAVLYCKPVDQAYNPSNNQKPMDPPTYVCHHFFFFSWQAEKEASVSSPWGSPVVIVRGLL